MTSPAPENIAEPRRLLPAREEILVMTDVSQLSELEAVVEAAKKRIEVDLEYSDRDDDWARRAMGALTVHNICLANIRKRLHFLTGKKDANVQVHLEQKNAKTARRLINAQVAEADAKKLAIAVEHKKIAAKNRLINYLERHSFLGQFHQEAREFLDKKNYQLLHERAMATLKNKVTQDLEEVLAEEP